ncbi:MAG: hypothetical protein OEU92_24680, partial [Alphaproteobacteria bacterium]|nr:hypothetical protein [Alphaproteobacteria bacterium]
LDLRRPHDARRRARSHALVQLRHASHRLIDVERGVVRPDADAPHRRRRPSGATDPVFFIDIDALHGPLRGRSRALGDQSAPFSPHSAS